MQISRVQNIYPNTTFKANEHRNNNQMQSLQSSKEAENKDRTLLEELSLLANYAKYRAKTMQIRLTPVSSFPEDLKRNYVCALRKRTKDEYVPRLSNEEMNTIMQYYTIGNRHFMRYLVDKSVDESDLQSKPLYSGNDIATIMSAYTPEKEDFMKELVDSSLINRYDVTTRTCTRKNTFTPEGIATLTELYTPENKELIERLVHSHIFFINEEYAQIREDEILDFVLNSTPEQVEIFNKLYNPKSSCNKSALLLAKSYNESTKDNIDMLLDDFDNSHRQKDENVIGSAFYLYEIWRSETPENLDFLKSLLAERSVKGDSKSLPKYQYSEVYDLLDVYTPENEETMRQVLELTDKGYYSTNYNGLNMQTVYSKYGISDVARLISQITPENKDAIFELLSKTRRVNGITGDLPILPLSDVAKIANIYTPEISKLLDKLIADCNLSTNEVVNTILH